MFIVVVVVVCSFKCVGSVDVRWFKGIDSIVVCSLKCVCSIVCSLKGVCFGCVQSL